MSWTLAGYTCVAIASSVVTIAIVSETQPYINEDGEEEYTLSGYMILAAAYVVKLPFKILFELIKGNGNKDQSVEDHKPTFEMDREANEHELII